MKIASFGDIHLGPSAKRDRFCHQELDLLEFSAYLQQTHDCALLLGDVFQSDWGWKLGPSSGELDVILRRYERVWQAWSDPFFRLLAGNHDHVSTLHLGAQKTVQIAADGVRIFYLHGDVYDAALRGPGPDMTMWLVGRLRSMGLRYAAALIEDKILQPLGAWYSDGDPIRQAADEIGVTNDSQIVVAGHTHVHVCEPLNTVVYANSGAFEPRCRMYVSIDTQARSVELMKYEAGGSTTRLQGVCIDDVARK